MPREGEGAEMEVEREWWQSTEIIMNDKTGKTWKI